MNKIQQFAEAQARHEGFYIKGSVAKRNRNPGNLVYGPLAQSFGSTTFWTHPKTKHDFAIFPTVEQGWQALYRLIENAATGKSKVYHPEMTILEYASKYAPVRDEKGKLIPNHNYANSISKQTGLPITTKIKYLIENPMAYPLTYWKTYKRGYTFGVPTSYSNFHLGLDVICPIGTKLYAWDDCEVVKVLKGPQGGNTIWVKADGMLFRFLHLNKPGVVGKFREGDVIGETGNTGLSTGPHVHIDISKNGKLELNNRKNFIDPEKYFDSIQVDPCNKCCKAHCPK